LASPPSPKRLLQANMQSWHPTHLSASTTVSLVIEIT
jgi:hypothetical protein